jgi:hypothetical protein
MYLLKARQRNGYRFGKTIWNAATATTGQEPGAGEPDFGCGGTDVYRGGL